MTGGWGKIIRAARGMTDVADGRLEPFVSGTGRRGGTIGLCLTRAAMRDGRGDVMCGFRRMSLFGEFVSKFKFRYGREVDGFLILKLSIFDSAKNVLPPVGFEPTHSLRIAHLKCAPLDHSGMVIF